MTCSVVMKAYPCNDTLMKVLIASSSGFNICEIPGSWNMCTMSELLNETRKSCVRFSKCKIYLNFQLFYPFVHFCYHRLFLILISQQQHPDDDVHRLLSLCFGVIFIRQQQHPDDDVHRLLSLCYSLGVFHFLFWYTIPSLLTMISICLRNNQGKNHNTKHLLTIHLICVFYPLYLNRQQKLREPGFLHSS